MTTETMTAERPAAGSIPTEPTELEALLRKLTPGAQTEVADLLAAQLGGTPEAIERATDLVWRALGAIENENAIVQERANLAQHIADALASIRAADASLTNLCGDLYDVEYAEGGQRVLDLRTFLDDAARLVRAAAAFNPCPPDTTKGGA